MVASQMKVITIARNKKCTIIIDKKDITENKNDLETVPLPFTVHETQDAATGTTITLSELDTRLNFPNADKLRELLIYEYGRAGNFKVFVNGKPLSSQDIPGSSNEETTCLPISGKVFLNFTISSGKRPLRSPGIMLKVNGKAVGRPMLFGLEEDEELPQKLLKRVYGEVEVNGGEDFVTADWGGVLENSKSFQEIRNYVRNEVRLKIQIIYAQEIQLQKARLQRQINKRLEKLPEYRRKYAEQALNRILARFYNETEDRIAAIAEVALDAMEQDAYWAVLDRINKSSDSDIGSFAASLEEFGFLELATIGKQATWRREFLNYVEKLTCDPKTLEQDAHKAFENNLWLLGRKYSLMSSNVTLHRIIEIYGKEKYKGKRAAKRPDLLLSQDYGDTYLLIEFKRPSHDITRDDIAQAEKYRDDLLPQLSSTSKIEIMMIGKGRAKTLSTNHLEKSISIYSYASIISSARHELDWLINSLCKK